MATSPSNQALGRDGVFARRIRSFKPRPAQQQMAEAVEETLAHGGTLVAESATGTGKTFAYLVPLVLAQQRAIISTATKHLQEQLFHHDLPAVGCALEKPINAVLLKGRANYLCRYRLRQQTEALAQGDLLESSDGENQSLRLIENWANATRSGDIAEVSELSEDAPLWRRVTSTADNCLGGGCPDFHACFVHKARQDALRADIVVVNHHLFFSDQTLKLEGFGELLPTAQAVVFDEAHAITEIASQFFGFGLSSGQLAELESDARAAESQENSGLDFAPITKRLFKSLRRVFKACKKFVGKSVEFNALQSREFDAASEELRAALVDYEIMLAAAAVAGEGLQRCHQRCLALQENLESWFSGHDRNLIRWAEIKADSFRLRATPLRVAEQFLKLREKHPAAWVFTSATLAVEDDFSAFCSQLGLQDAQTHTWGSPYDFQRNALLYLPPDLPEPRESGYPRALCQVIRQVTDASRGRAFCLFTSHNMMQKTYAQFSAQSSWHCLVQGQAPKSELLQQFKAHGGAILFATFSFWEGVDVVGEKLSCVIIDKLPFAPPDDPVLKSRCQVYEEEDGNAFLDIQIPQAVIALKQGAGRLIRAETDRGVLVLCDSRLRTKPYGKRFLNSLPAMPRTQSLHDVRGFFRRKNG